jgi:prepilin peptidase CpaA
MIFGGMMDMFTLTIPNRVSLVLIAAFFLAALVTGMSWTALGAHVATGLAVLLFGFALFAGGFIGGGDAKLLAAAALWLGFNDIALYVLYVAVAGGLLALVIVAYRAIIPPPFLMRQPWAMRLHAKAGGMPYGLALAAAALAIFPSTAWFQSLAG